jgi:hypothetical protein
MAHARVSVIPEDETEKQAEQLDEGTNDAVSQFLNN